MGKKEGTHHMGLYLPIEVVCPPLYCLVYMWEVAIVGGR